MAMYRGLSTFISDIRTCKTKEQEQQRIDKELANVRAAFTSGKMSPYDRKKYVWKLVYVNMMGYDVDFGHVEMINLLSQPTYAEKLVGYMAVSVLMKNTDPQITLVVQAIKNDLQSTQDPVQCLALCAIANIGGKELTESVAVDVQRILLSRSIFPVVRKKAALCLLRLSRINKDLLPPEEWCKKLTNLLEDKNMGVVLSVVTLIQGLGEKNPEVYDSCTGHLLVWLTKLSIQKQVPEDYLYHGVACPWIQVRVLRTLQLFPIPALEAMRVRLNDILVQVMSKTEVTKSVNRNNAEHCILFEAINLVIKQGEASLPELRAKAVAHLSKFINIREPNIRYLGLEAMTRLAHLEGVADALRKQQATILFSLKDADISIRRRALDLLFALCNKEVAPSVVKELLTYLAIADWQIRDEMVLKTAILAERFAPDLRWYVDTILALMSIAGDHVSDEIWHRVVQIVTNHEDLQRYAASRMYAALEPATAHETAVKTGGYILGEFGYLLNESADGDEAISGPQQFAALHQHFTKMAPGTKAILLSAYAKMQNLYPELRAIVLPVFEALSSVLDTELQQRALEYMNLPNVSEDTLAAVLDAMPPFPERGSSLEEKLRRQKEETQDKDEWGKEDKPEEADSARGGDERAEAASGGYGQEEEAPAASGRAGKGGAAAPAPSTMDDLLGLSPAPAPAAVDPLTVPVTRRVTVESPEAVAKSWAAVVTKPRGVLFEDAHVQVGVQRQFTGAAGKLTLFIGNKSTTTSYVAVKLRVPETPTMKVTVGEVPTSVGPKAQIRVEVTVEAAQPFVDSPALQMSFIGEPGTGHAYALRVPAALHNFCDPIAMPGPDFKNRWGTLGGQPREVVAVITPASGAGAVSVAAAQQGLALINMSNVDAGAPGATGASTYRTTTLAPSGQPISVGCLAMAIPDAGTGVFKVAVRTQHGDVSKALMAALQAHLSAL